jgi:hypothetical protein
MSQQPRTRRDDLIEKACGDKELTAFIEAISNTKINKISDRVHERFWDNEIVWEAYWDLVDDELCHMRDEIARLKKGDE